MTHLWGGRGFLRRLGRLLWDRPIWRRRLPPLPPLLVFLSTCLYPGILNIASSCPCISSTSNPTIPSEHNVALKACTIRFYHRKASRGQHKQRQHPAPAQCAAHALFRWKCQNCDRSIQNSNETRVFRFASHPQNFTFGKV